MFPASPFFARTIASARPLNALPVTSAAQWPKRRAEIVEDFESEVYGRIPINTPQVTWEVTGNVRGNSGGVATITRTLLGHVDNRMYPLLQVDIEASLTIPADGASVPLLVEISSSARPDLSGPRAMRDAAVAQRTLAIEHGWGYGWINAWSIQPDNDDLKAGIIGLCNQGRLRKADDWGALRAWQWGVSRLIDYVETNPDTGVNPKQIGVAGIARWGKAAIVTEAFEPRVAAGIIGSSGGAGTKLFRHVYGETLERIADNAAYQWVAPNFLKYAAEDPMGSPADLPVDAHELISLCAPRPCFISHGFQSPEMDPPWVDQHGSYMAGVLAGPVYELLGRHGFGNPKDYLTDPMPPLNMLVGGALAWRQHDGGDDLGPNYPIFFDWVAPYFTGSVATANAKPAR